MWLFLPDLYDAPWKSFKGFITRIKQALEALKRQTSYGDEAKKKRISSVSEVCFLKSLLINITILYSISIHTLFHSDSFKLSVFYACLSSCLSGRMSGYVWDEPQRVSARIFITLLVAQWVGVTVNQLEICVFFVLLNLQNDGSCLKNGFHSFRISEKVFTLIFCPILSRLSPSLPPVLHQKFLSSTSVPHSESLADMFKRWNRRRNSPLWQKRG